jgi:ribose-phosphate pyrophosphokinase
VRRCCTGSALRYQLSLRGQALQVSAPPRRCPFRQKLQQTLAPGRPAWRLPDPSCRVTEGSVTGVDDFILLAGSASRRLGQAIADYLDCPLGASETLHFSEGNLFVRVLENVRGRDVFLVQGTAFPANDNFMELLFWIDALKRASARSVTAVIPYFSYAKGDKKDEPRVSIRARVCADAIEAAGVDRVVTLDLHAPQVQGFFKVPVDDLYAMPVLCDAIAAKALGDLVVVAPDAGFAKKARQWSRRLHAPLAIADKQRVDHSESAEVVELIGSVEGRAALIVDDFTISAGTLADAARVLVERGATSVHAAVTHGLLAGPAIGRIDDSPIERLFMTDSVETQPVELSPKIEVISVAGLLGEAIRRIARRESISVLFS